MRSLFSFLKDPSGLQSCYLQVKADIDNVRSVLHDMKEHSSKSFDEILEDYKKYAQEQEARADFYSMSLEYIGDLFPDMLWMKWTNGKYAYANKAIRDGLLFDDRPLEKDDVELGSNAQKFFGANKHNFGTYCAGSDTLTIESGHRKRFIEYGMSGGKPLVLEVFKNVVRDAESQEIIATVGVGRDITDNIFTMLKLEEVAFCNAENCANTNPVSKDIINEYLSKYLFENETIPETLRDFYHNNKEDYYA